ncbi:hypothetical protein M8O16_05170 [Enterobacter hormaechei]|nr:hypothetical protein [Enterobacter hormaechei]
MSEINPHDAAQTLSQERKTLHYLVWCWHAERITVLYGISTGLLAKRCSEMQIPKPLAGYWVNRPGNPGKYFASVFRLPHPTHSVKFNTLFLPINQ